MSSQGRKALWFIPVGLLVVLLVSLSLYLWIIPRTELEVRTVYHESPGGGGTGGVMNVNVLLTNMGNREVSSLTCNVVVMSDGSTVHGRSEGGSISLSRMEVAEISMHFTGSQYEEYTITVSLSFNCCGNTEVEDLEFTTSEDEMNLVFVEKVG